MMGGGKVETRTPMETANKHRENRGQRKNEMRQGNEAKRNRKCG